MGHKTPARRIARGSPDQPRDDHGRWSGGGASSGSSAIAELDKVISDLHDQMESLNRSTEEFNAAMDGYSNATAEESDQAKEDVSNAASTVKDKLSTLASSAKDHLNAFASVVEEFISQTINPLRQHVAGADKAANPSETVSHKSSGLDLRAFERMLVALARRG